MIVAACQLLINVRDKSLVGLDRIISPQRTLCWAVIVSIRNNIYKPLEFWCRCIGDDYYGPRDPKRRNIIRITFTLQGVHIILYNIYSVMPTVHVTSPGHRIDLKHFCNDSTCFQIVNIHACALLYIKEKCAWASARVYIIIYSV